jgi:hypothetical protein
VAAGERTTHDAVPDRARESWQEDEPQDEPREVPNEQGGSDAEENEKREEVRDQVGPPGRRLREPLGISFLEEECTKPPLPERAPPP